MANLAPKVFERLLDQARVVLAFVHQERERWPVYDGQSWHVNASERVALFVAKRAGYTDDTAPCLFEVKADLWMALLRDKREPCTHLADSDAPSPNLNPNPCRDCGRFYCDEIEA